MQIITSSSALCLAFVASALVNLVFFNCSPSFSVREIFRQRMFIHCLGLLGVTDAAIEEGEGRNDLELVRSVSNKHLDLLRPSARYNFMFKGSYSVCDLYLLNKNVVSVESF